MSPGEPPSPDEPPTPSVPPSPGVPAPAGTARAPDTGSPLTAARIARALRRPEPTPEQRRVIEAPLQPLLVVAGAGSGKTETMAARVVWLVATGRVAPEEVLGLTFTRKAAGELADRVRARLRALRRTGVLAPRVADRLSGGGEPVVATYHSYAASLVADHGLRVGVEPRSRLLGEAACWQLATRVVESHDGDLGGLAKAPATVVDAVLTLSAECAEHLVPPEQVGDLLDTVLARVAALPRDAPGGPAGSPYAKVRDACTTLAERRQLVPLLQRYARAKRAAGALDFGDQVALAARVAEAAPAVCAGERARARVVLLDEYQDTSHAQLSLLRSLFGGGHPVTAVGDPHQSIYGWRGASAGNLQTFPEHFPTAGGEPAAVTDLATSWRNDVAVLDAANTLAAPLRAVCRVPVRPLAARPGAGAGRVEVDWHATTAQEVTALAARVAALWAQDDEVVASGGDRRSTAVLCRRRSQLPAVETALRDAGLPVEVVGLGGLLTRPEVLDLVSVLRVLDDPRRGDALVRLLTGPRWRIGPRDLEALAAWSAALAHRQHAAGPGPRAEPGCGEDDTRSLVDALDDLPSSGWRGPHGRGLSPAGRQRLQQAAALLRGLRSRTAAPLPELVVEVERALGLDVELAARPGVAPAAARAQLDAFADVAAGFADAADSVGSPLSAFCAWLAAAAERERGLEAADDEDDPARASDDVEPSRTAVQVLTVHAAKGLEWDVVAVPGLVEGTFPACRGGRAGGTDTSSGWLGGLGVLPYPLRGDAASLPQLGWRSAAHQKQLAELVARFRADCGAHEVAEERRLGYVAATRARSLLLLSGSWWRDGSTPARPSRFLTELVAAAPGLPGVTADAAVAGLARPPEAGDSNPALSAPGTATWPHDPLGPRRPAVERAAASVRAAAPDAPAGEWDLEVELLLAERDAARHEAAGTVRLPAHLSASRLVDLAADPAAFARTLRRPVPVEPRAQTRVGTAFHAWLEARFRADTLVDLDDLPGASDDGAAPDDELARLQRTFLASPWAHRDPVAVEVDVETPVAGVVLRGRIDAVFRDAGGGWDVVDWKTGPPPTGARLRAAAVQLAVYRLAWSRLRGVPVAEVGAAFFHASTGDTVRPVDPLDEQALVDLLRGVPVG